ncbi:MAG: prefoldin subunit alpha [Candidatus Aenigmatarchaeota archaeon]
MEKELQRKYLQLQLFKQQLNAMAEEKAMIDERMSELFITIDAISKLGKIKQGEEIWSSLGSGAFVRSGIKDTENVLVSIGAGVVVSETKEKTMEILKSRVDELMKIDSDMVAEINKLSKEVYELESEIQQLAEKK